MTYGADAERYYDYLKDKRDAEADAYDEWVEDNDLDPDEDHWEAWEQYCDGMREAAAEFWAEQKADIGYWGDDY